MKVLYLINHAGGGGSEKYVYNLVKAYNGIRCKCCFAYNESGLLSKQMAQDKIVTFNLEMKNPFDFKAAKALADICKKNKVDIIHTHYPRENCIANLAKLYYGKIKVVYTNHFLTENNFSWKLINRLISARTNAIIAVCSYGKQLLVKNGYPSKKINVIFNGAPKKDACDEVTSTIREELGIPKDSFTVCTLARFSPEKRMRFLVEVMHRVKQLTDRDIRCIIAGDGAEFEAVKEKIEEYGLENTVYCIGYRTDGDNILSGSDIFVNTSETEALSFAIVEALGFGLPAVVSKVGGNVDIVNDATDCGFAIDKDDVEGFAKAIIELAANSSLYERKKSGALNSSAKLFSLENSLEETFKVYEKVLNK